MTDTITFTIDDVEVTASPGQTIMDAALDAGIYIPHLCHKPGLEPYGACRLCTVLVNGRPQTACTYPASDGMIVENDVEEIFEVRKSILDMLFVEGNHYCMFCEKSGNCELQAQAYRHGILHHEYRYQYPDRDVDATHPDVMIDHNRCILCARCIRASRDLDGKHVFQFVGRGPDKRVGINARARLSDTEVDITDEVMDICPVGALMRKRVGFSVPIGERKYDASPIGSDIEQKSE